MAPQNRRLAALVSADVVGYTRMMQLDETGTYARLKARYTNVVAPAIERFGGRVFKLMGDGLLAEFPSIVSAVEWAVETQIAVAAANDAEPELAPITYRIGINLGDVIVDGTDLYGDGLNVAARLQERAEPGGLCMSDAAYQQVRGKIDARLVAGGNESLKNVSAPVQVWRWSARATETSGSANMLAPVPGFVGRPAIAVLAFTNMSQDPEQEFLADGISEDILTRLAMWRWLPVIARNSSFVYKGQAVDVKKVGQDLGARYVLEGSVRRSGSRVRVTGQLIDADTGRHVWADRYDRQIDDIFALQDEITDAVVAALEPAVGRAEMLRSQRQTPSDVDAWALFQGGMSQLTKATREGLVAAKTLFRKSAGIDPTFARPLAAIAIADFIENTIGFSENALENMRDAHQAAERAIALDDLEPFAHAGLAYASFMNGSHDTAVAAGRRGVELNPSFALGYHALAASLYTNSDQEEAISAIRTAIRISPNDPFFFFFLGVLSAAHYMLGEYAEAARIAGQGAQRFPWYASAHRWHAMALAQLGRADEASEAFDTFLRLSPSFDLAAAERSYTFRKKRDLDHYLEGLRKAGLTR